MYREELIHLKPNLDYRSLFPNLYQALKNIKVLAFDFDGIFTTNSVLISETGEEMVECSRYDGIGICKIKDHNLYPVVISKEKNIVVKKRCQKLKIDCHDGIEQKLTILKSICDEFKIGFDRVLYMGNDINDIECLNMAGVAVVVPDAHPTVFKYAGVVTSQSGGKGAVREICDLICQIKGLP